jgi:hypothetical protein
MEMSRLAYRAYFIGMAHSGDTDGCAGVLDLRSEAGAGKVRTSLLDKGASLAS